MNESGIIEERLELEKEITLFLAQCFLELDEGERQLMKQFGLTITQYWALVHLENEEGRSFTELAELLICDKSNVTSIVDKFEESGLAKRERGKAGDRRYVRIVLTPRGQQLRKVLISAQQHLLRQRFQAISVESLQQLHAPLQQLAGALQAQSRSKEVPAMIDYAIERMRSEQGAEAGTVLPLK